jgi:hypothetical protein
MDNSSSFLASRAFQRITNQMFVFSVFISLVGLLFKIMHYPGSDIMIPLSLGVLANLSIILLFEPISKDYSVLGLNSKLLTTYKFLLGFGSSIFLIGGLFFVQHYPGGKALLILGLIAGLSSLLMTWYIVFFKKASVLPFSKLISIVMFSFFITGGVSSFMMVSRSILDSFVELNIAKEQDVIKELEFGNLEIKKFKNDSTNLGFENSIIYIKKIDEITDAQIKYLDALKMEILNMIGEDPINFKPGNSYSIISEGYDDDNPLRPIQVNLQNVMNKDKYDEVMLIFGISKNLSKPDTYKCKFSNIKGGIEIWNNMLRFRGQLCSLLVSSASTNDMKYSFIDPKIVQFIDFKDLQEKFDSSLKKCRINPNDYSALTEIYISLTKNEKVENRFSPSGVHWLTSKFNHAPAISAISTLTDLQKEVISVRRLAISAIVNRN